jgi:hypothetical protein
MESQIELSKENLQLVLKNSGMGTSDRYYIEPHLKGCFLLSTNYNLDYASIEDFDLVNKVKYDYYFSNNMSQAYEDFWDMTDSEKLTILLDLIPWTIEECECHELKEA